MSREIQYWHLRNHKLFSVLSNAQVEELCIIMRYKKAAKGEIIYFSEEPEKRIFLIKKGKIKIVESDDKGNEIIKEILIQGDLLGEISLDSNSTSREYAQALTGEVVFCSFKVSDFEEVLEKYPSLALKYTKIVGFRFKRIKNNYSNLVFKDVKSRLKTFIKDWAEREGTIVDHHVNIENYLTHQDIAGLICSTRQTVTQLLNELEEEKLIRYTRKEIIVEDLRRLN